MTNPETLPSLQPSRVRCDMRHRLVSNSLPHSCCEFQVDGGPQLVWSRMTVLCAWCRKQIAGNERSETGLASHGICPDCTDNFQFQEGGSLRDYIESMPFPVAVFDSEMRLRFANAKASEIMGKTLDGATGDLVGDVFECAHARLPEGCGRTIHCSGCTIRRTLTEVHNSAKPQWTVPATLTKSDTAVSMEISVVKTGEILWLRIDGFRLNG